MHDARFAAAAWLDKITRSQNDAASPAEHNRSVWVFHGCFDDDASTFGKVVPPRSTQRPIILLKESSKPDIGSISIQIYYITIRM